LTLHASRTTLHEQRFTVRTIDPLSDDRWPEFVERHPRASVFHSGGWLRALRTTYGYEPVAVTTCAPLEPLTNALVFCVVRSWLTGVRLVSLPFSDHCEPLVASPEEFGALTAFVEDLRKARGLKYVELRSADPSLPFDGPYSRSATYALHRLDLRPDLDALYRGLHKDCLQRKIRRAEREGLSYEGGVNESLIDRLYPLLQSTRARHRLPPQPIEWFRNVVGCLGPAVRIALASHGGRAVAGIVTLRQGKSLVYKYGASEAAWNHLGGMVMLLWNAIADAKRDGCEWLDLGRSDLDNPGLIVFKERWGAERTVLATWRTPPVAVSSRRERVTMEWAKGLFSRLPSPVQTFAGRLLYRHIG
jgi:CelD/BcsL family acetyltransferase involved in cellulose biosynthesis